MTWTTQPRSKLGGLAAITRGSGPNVLLLHGVGLRAEAWGAQFDLPARIVAPDMPGHGESPWDGQDMSITDYVRAARRVFDDLEGPVILVGHSMGAMLALELANRTTTPPRAVVALNAVFERKPAAQEAVKNRATALDGTTRPDPSPTLERWFSTAPSAERDACESWLNSVNPAAYKSAYTAFATSKIPDRSGLTRLPCPALFMTGAQEPNSTPAMSETMASLAPQGRSIIVEGAAHMMPMTHPKDVNAALRSLIAEITA